jgi:hypothetical protein
MAVAWVSQGHEAEGQGALSEVSDPAGLARFESRADVWLPDGMFHALMALTSERAQPEMAAKHYQALAGTDLAKTALGKLSTRPRLRSAAPTAAKRAP